MEQPGSCFLTPELGSVSSPVGDVVAPRFCGSDIIMISPRARGAAGLGPFPSTDLFKNLF